MSEATMDRRRRDFICTPYSMSERGRAHLLAIEDDAELVELKRVALHEQHFEMAASIVAEAKRRKFEIPV